MSGVVAAVSLVRVANHAFPVRSHVDLSACHGTNAEHLVEKDDVLQFEVAPQRVHALQTQIQRVLGQKGGLAATCWACYGTV